jgi:hypothetical protein
MSNSNELDHLIEEYERLADVHDSGADQLVTMAARHGWDPQIIILVDDLRGKAETNRALAQEVRDSRT